MGIEIKNVRYCYIQLLKLRRNTVSYDSSAIASHLGYLEACLLSFDALDTETVDDELRVERLLVKSHKWWKKDRKESYEEAIIRQVEKLLKEREGE